MYVLLHTWDHENGQGAEAQAISEDKMFLRCLMQEKAQELKKSIQEAQGRDESLWASDLTEYDDGYINLGYEEWGLPNTWRWEIQEVDSPETPIAKVVVILEDGMVQEGYSDHPELVDLDVIDLDSAAVEDDEETADALYDAADEVRKTLKSVY